MAWAPAAVRAAKPVGKRSSPPPVPAAPPPEPQDTDPIAGPTPSAGPDALTLDAIAPVLAAEGLEPLPPAGASADAIEAWVERFIDASARPPHEEPDSWPQVR